MRNILRASRGITSSLLAFWLIPAIRKKERKGPGMAAVAGTDGSGDWTMRSCGAGGPGGTAPRTRGARLEQTNAITTTRAERRRAYFIAATHPNHFRDVPQLR